MHNGPSSQLAWVHFWDAIILEVSRFFLRMHQIKPLKEFFEPNIFLLSLLILKFLLSYHVSFINLLRTFPGLCHFTPIINYCSKVFPSSTIFVIHGLSTWHRVHAQSTTSRKETKIWRLRPNFGDISNALCDHVQRKNPIQIWKMNNEFQLLLF